MFYNGFGTSAWMAAVVGNKLMYFGWAVQFCRKPQDGNALSLLYFPGE